MRQASRRGRRARTLIGVIVAVAAGLVLSGCHSGVTVLGSAPRCPDGLVAAVADRVSWWSSSDVAAGSVSDIEPASLRPLLGDACIVRYTTVSGIHATYVFSTTVSMAQVGSAVSASGYSTAAAAWNAAAVVFGGTQYAVKDGNDFASVTVSPVSVDGTFSHFFPCSAIAVQTLTPPPAGFVAPTTAPLTPSSTTAPLPAKLPADACSPSPGPGPTTAAASGSSSGDGSQAWTPNESDCTDSYAYLSYTDQMACLSAGFIHGTPSPGFTPNSTVCSDPSFSDLTMAEQDACAANGFGGE